MNELNTQVPTSRSSRRLRRLTRRGPVQVAPPQGGAGAPIASRRLTRGRVGRLGRLVVVVGPGWWTYSTGAALAVPVVWAATQWAFGSPVRSQLVPAVLIWGFVLIEGLVHELSHVVVARIFGYRSSALRLHRRGMSVGIDPSAQWDRRPERIAVAGPIATGVCALVAAVALAPVTAASLPSAIVLGGYAVSAIGSSFGEKGDIGVARRARAAREAGEAAGEDDCNPEFERARLAYKKARRL